jgi:pilus assembly protein Flp/PilA
VTARLAVFAQERDFETICRRICDARLADFYDPVRISADGALAGAFKPERLRALPATEGNKLMSDLLWLFVADERGATAIEYGLLAAGIAGAIIAVVFTLGTNVNSTFSSVSSALN